MGYVVKNSQVSDFEMKQLFCRLPEDCIQIKFCQYRMKVIVECTYFADLWQQFDMIQSVETKEIIQGFIVCKLCPKIMRYKPVNGSSNALSHTKKNHTMPENVPKIDQFIPKKKMSINAVDKGKLVDAALKIVTTDLRPYAVVEGEGMLHFTHTIWNLGAKYGNIQKEDLIEIMPSAITMSRQVKLKAVIEKNRMGGLLQTMFASCLFFGLTCDLWQDDFHHLSYLVLTAHFYNDNMKLCDQMISLLTLDVARKKDGPFIRQSIKQALEIKNIVFDPNKLIFVTDRGSNIKNALQDFTRLNCFPHFMNNTVREACKIDIIQTTIKQCSELVRYMKISGLNNEFRIVLKSAVKTRFNSTLIMIDSIMLNWAKLNDILIRENEQHRINNIEFDTLKQMNDFLKPFKHWSDHSEKSKSPSLCNVWIAIDSIIKHCAVGEDDEHLTTLMKVKALCYIEKRFVLHKFHRIATFLNPNYKCLKFASVSLYEKTINDTREMMASIPDTDAEAQVLMNRRESVSSASTIESELSNYCNIVEEDELDAYIRQNHFTDLSLDPGVWWYEHRKDYPKLSKVAIAIHAIPSSSTPSERVFSGAGLVVTDHRTNLNPNSIEDILVLRSQAEKFSSNNIW